MSKIQRLFKKVQSNGYKAISLYLSENIDKILEETKDDKF